MELTTIIFLVLVLSSVTINMVIGAVLAIIGIILVFIHPPIILMVSISILVLTIGLNLLCKLYPQIYIRLLLSKEDFQAIQNFIKNKYAKNFTITAELTAKEERLLADYIKKECEHYNNALYKD